MTKDELIQEINACSSFHIVCHDGNFIIPTAIIRSIQKCGDGDE